ncbi:hypothetical protein WKK05_06405 [Nostoc sp. UHCC 0302]|uniref:hypothetical protein n=1 Tax=Nostoc sp. UHCC 0302 TaxID=3134896 RepID=UPI00311CB6F4
MAPTYLLFGTQVINKATRLTLTVLKTDTWRVCVSHHPKKSVKAIALSASYQ